MNALKLGCLLASGRSQKKEQARRLASQGKMAKARRHIFEAMAKRAERFGENSDQSLETLIWLAHVHLERASLDLAIVQRLFHLASQNGSLCTLEAFHQALSMLNAAEQNIGRARTALNYAERKTEEQPRASIFYIELELTLFLINQYLFKSPSENHLDKSLAAAKTLLIENPDQQVFNAVDKLLELLYANYGEANKYAAIAQYLAEKSKELRVLQEQHVVQMSLLH